MIVVTRKIAAILPMSSSLRIFSCNENEFYHVVLFISHFQPKPTSTRAKKQNKTHTYSYILIFFNINIRWESCKLRILICFSLAFKMYNFIFFRQDAPEEEQIFRNTGYD